MLFVHLDVSLFEAECLKGSPSATWNFIHSTKCNLTACMLRLTGQHPCKHLYPKPSRGYYSDEDSSAPILKTLDSGRVEHVITGVSYLTHRLCRRIA